MDDKSAEPERRETPLERADRNFAELLQELRVTQTGVQILFAFLLALAFTARFPALDGVQRGTYVTTLLLAVLAAALFMAPAALHRSLFRRHAKPRVVELSSRLAVFGMAALGLSLTGSVLLVVDVTLGRAEGIAAGAGTLALHAGLWGAMPLMVRRGTSPGGAVTGRGGGRFGSDGPGGTGERRG